MWEAELPIIQRIHCRRTGIGYYTVVSEIVPSIAWQKRRELQNGMVEDIVELLTRESPLGLRIEDVVFRAIIPRRILDSGAISRSDEDAGHRRTYDKPKRFNRIEKLLLHEQVRISSLDPDIIRGSQKR